MIHSLLFAVLIGIISGILILSIPGCNRLKQSAVEAFSRMSGRYLKYGVFSFYVFVGLLLVGQLFEIMSIRSSNAGNDPLRAERLLSSQRDAYLAGGVLILFLCMSQIYSLIRQTNKLKASKEAILRQAQGASKFGRKMLAEQNAAASKNTAKKAGSEATAQEEKLKSLRAEIAVLKKAKTQSSKDIESVKAQAEAQGKEYLRLIDENKSLKNQLEDFELLLGDKKKKQI